MSELQAVLFDYGMVLSGSPDGDAWKSMKQVLCCQDEPLQQAYWRFRDAYDRGALSGVKYWLSVGRALGRSLTPPELDALLAADTQYWGRPNEEMIGWAARLQRAGVPTGVLSNLGDAMEAGLRARCPWLEEFAHHTFSHRLGIAKPDRAIYDHAASGLGVPAQAILFVDDKVENVAGAQAAGLKAIRYGEHGAFVAEMEKRGFGPLWRVGAGEPS